MHVCISNHIASATFEGCSGRIIIQLIDNGNNSTISVLLILVLRRWTRMAVTGPQGTGTNPPLFIINLNTSLTLNTKSPDNPLHRQLAVEASLLLKRSSPWAKKSPRAIHGSLLAIDLETMTVTSLNTMQLQILELGLVILVGRQS
jgi:hypothetical protein